MRVVQSCSKCGAERVSWMGDGHVKRCLKHGKIHEICCDGQSAEEIWRHGRFYNMHIPGPRVRDVVVT